MCGIYAYIGKKDQAASIVLDGLKLLEYRGYDSWGVAAKPKTKNIKHKNGNGHFIVEKHIGKIGNAILSSQFTVDGSQLAIGHTRWATHGGVTEANAHPHVDCSKTIAVVHNGIIENFVELKNDLLKKGHKFLSETDTEVIPHLIEENLKTRGFATSVRDAFNMLSGMNAIVVAYAPAAEIIAAKTGSPLVIGIGNEELFIASDAAGIVKHTKNVLFLEDKQMVILGKDVQLFSLPDGKKIPQNIQKLDWVFEDAQKGNFKHFFMKEVAEQPRVLETIATHSLEDTKKFSRLIEKAYGTFMLGCGSASYAGLAGTYFFSSIAKKHVNFAIGSEFTYIEDYVTAKTLVIPISQSGESIDVIEPVLKAQKEKGAKIAAIVNVLGSTLYRQADFKMLLNAGQEKSVCATKSFIAMIAILLLTAYTLAKKQAEGKALLLQAALNVKELMKDKTIYQIKTLAKKLKNAEHIYIIGRGLSYPTALEATLKIKETACVHAEGFAGGELKHGVIALIEQGTPCIVFAPNDETYDEIVSNAQEVKARGGFIIGIGPKNNGVFAKWIETADIKEATMIPQIVVSQLLAYELALARGIEDPDKPRNLAKSVTVK